MIPDVKQHVLPIWVMICRCVSDLATEGLPP
jgi:hypothetical protein